MARGWHEGTRAAFYYQPSEVASGSVVFCRQPLACCVAIDEVAAVVLSCIFQTTDSTAITREWFKDLSL